MSIGSKRWKILPGFKKNRLTLVERIVDARGKSRKGIFLCECGKTTATNIYDVSDGKVMSCGCYFREMARDRLKTHGMSKTREFKMWVGMHKRCNNRNEPCYIHYGGRGIKVCERWHKFENFYADMGDIPIGYSVERLDVNGNYEPSNCTLIPKGDQNKNTRATIRLTYNGKTMPISDWSRELGISRDIIRNRHRKGLSIEEILCPKDSRGEGAR